MNCKSTYGLLNTLTVYHFEINFKLFKEIQFVSDSVFKTSLFAVFCTFMVLAMMFVSFKTIKKNDACTWLCSAIWWMLMPCFLLDIFVSLILCFNLTYLITLTRDSFNTDKYEIEYHKRWWFFYQETLRNIQSCKFRDLFCLLYPQLYYVEILAAIGPLYLKTVSLTCRKLRLNGSVLLRRPYYPRPHVIVSMAH